MMMLRIMLIMLKIMITIMMIENNNFGNDTSCNANYIHLGNNSDGNNSITYTDDVNGYTDNSEYGDSHDNDVHKDKLKDYSYDDNYFLIIINNDNDSNIYNNNGIYSENVDNKRQWLL